MLPRHVGVHGCFPALQQSSATAMQRGSPEAGAKPKQGPALPGTACLSPRCSGIPRHGMGPVNQGRAGPRAPEHSSVPICCSLGAQRPTGCKDAEFGQHMDPVPSTGTEQDIPIRAKSIFIITACPPALTWQRGQPPVSPWWVFWGELHPTGLSPAGMGEGSACFGSWMGARAGRQQPCC